MITFKGKEVKLNGKLPKLGEYAPNFVVVDRELKEKTLNDFSDRIRIISSVPSLDTSVCSIETKKIEEMMKKFSDEFVFLTVSMDLPFAQSRWCGVNNVEKVITLSDYKYKSFGLNYGVYVSELGLLARAIFIVDKDNKLRYIQLVNEITNEPNYEDIESALVNIK
ncbi:MAG: thiol peroxidase [candidate division WOR-3 bacterium]|nr:thiol peroxidase [candidate division WOR-3 bacterium]MCX7947920.1 thiol peroxidase [candidate division WOR-3 bacterium]MDW8150864.1 thiol peroxidase [candidate division WOR-3 bacterium]